jgi:hypothetical protein
METLKLTGSGIAGTLPAVTAMGYQINSVEIDVPLDEVGSTDPQVTLSGVRTGAHTFHSSVSPYLRFTSNEQIDITTANFTAEYSVIIGYQKWGCQDAYMYNGGDRGAFIPIGTSLKKAAGQI